MSSINYNLNGQGVERTSTLSFGQGAYSDVYQGKYGTLKVALKTFRVEDDKEMIKKFNEYVRREITVWQGLEHPNVLSLIGYYDDPNLSRTSILVSPFCKNGNASNYVKAHPESDRVGLIRSVAHGLKHIHSKGAVHGDLKSANILIDDGGKPLICDFGLSRIVDQTGFTTGLKSTNRYAAPEVLDSEDTPTCKALTKASDVYAFAMTSWEILTGTVPFRFVPESRVVLRVTRGDRPKWSEYSLPESISEVTKVVEECWAQEPTSRPTMELVARQLEKIAGI